MLQNDFQPIIFYCNPNIYPEKEYLIRRDECTRYAQKLGLEIVEDDDCHEDWFKAHKDWLSCVKGLENEPERGSRCLLCFKLRLLATAKFAQSRGIELFTTTLASSRWKSLPQIDEAGKWAASQIEGTSYWDKNWRKGGLQERRNQLLAINGFYNQQYCGCEFSFRGSDHLSFQ